MALALLINQNGKATYQNGSKTMSKQYKDFKETDPLIYQRLLECQKEAGNPENDAIEIGASASEGGFYWGGTKEGMFIWLDVYNEEYSSFYAYYNIRNKKEQYATIQVPAKHLDAVKEFIKQLENH